MASVVQQREELAKKLFPGGIPQLWVPLLTFYDDNGEIDAIHTQAHHDFLSPHVNSFLTPGSTGDGWELTAHESDTVLKMQLEVAHRRRHSIMVGVLRTGKGEAQATIKEIVERYTGQEPPSQGGVQWQVVERLLRRRIVGLAITPPKGEGLSQQEIYDELAASLELGVPVALYQLPQVTQNEVEPETVDRKSVV